MGHLTGFWWKRPDVEPSFDSTGCTHASRPAGWGAGAKGKVSITGFGVFEVLHREARMVRNPRTGERKQAEAMDIPRFRPGTDLKKRVEAAAKK